MNIDMYVHVEHLRQHWCSLTIASACTYFHVLCTACTARSLLHRPFTSANAQQQHQHATAGATVKQTVAWQCGGGLCERSFNELNLLNGNYLNMQTTEEPRIVQYSLVAKGRAVLFGERAVPTMSRLVLYPLHTTTCVHTLEECDIVCVCKVQCHCESTA
jgi:hypothetical protein